MIFSRNKNSQGFTLVEMIVSLAVFSIVAVVALGALVKIVSANKKAQSLQESITSLNFALDSMSRELRTGSVYHCDEYSGASNYDAATLSKSSCAAQNAQQADLAFISSETAPNGTVGTCPLAYAYRFRYVDEVYLLEKAVQASCSTGIDDGDFFSIVDENVKITGYHMEVSADAYQRATIRISGFAGIREREKTFFDVQTTVASRKN